MRRGRVVKAMMRMILGGGDESSRVFVLGTLIQCVS